MSPLSYAVVTPVRNEAENVRRLHAALAAQNVKPSRWIIVDNGSSDETPDVLRELAERAPWIQTIAVPPAVDGARGGPIVRAFHAGLEALDRPTDLIGKVDADISMGPEHFGRLLAAFEADLLLGIASGSCYELQDGLWRQRFGTGSSVWGAARLYRAACLHELLPLDERMGWDGIDVVKANVAGWTTATLLDLPFRHHRTEGVRERGRWHAWTIQGDASHYMGYRFLYLVLRALFKSRRDAAALGMIWGYLAAAARRAPRCPDGRVRLHVRRAQRLRDLPARRRDALGRPAPLS